MDGQKSGVNHMVCATEQLSGFGTLPHYDYGQSTKFNSIVALSISVALGILALVTSTFVLQTSGIKIETTGYTYLDGLRPITLSLEASRVLSLLANFVIAGCTESLGYIHSTSLRWALFYEGRLQFNSNLRLFTSTRRSAANCWPLNILSALFLVFCYASASQIIYTDNSSTGSPALVLNGMALLMLGVGLLGESAIATMALLAGRKQILTWSPNPLNAALACLHKGALTRTPGRAMMPVHSLSLRPQPTPAAQKQQPIGTAYHAAKIVIRILWAAFLVAVVSAFLIFGLTKLLNRRSSYKFFPKLDDGGFVWFNIGGEYWPPLQQLLGGYLLGSAVQLILTLSLHCAELLVNVSRDEDAWRLLASKHGAQINPSALRSAASSWKWWILFLLKPVAQWLLAANSIQIVPQDLVTIYFNCLPLFVLSGLALILVGLGEYLLRRQVKGPQPACYGNLQTLVDLIDDWGDGVEGHLFWGSKGNVSSENAHAGTSSREQEVGDILIGELYE